jgi:hypothetical protein
VRSTLEKEASTLRADNKKLREMLTASMHEASNAHVESNQLRSESNVLHAQLADVSAQFNMKQEDLNGSVRRSMRPTIAWASSLAWRR